MSLAELIKEYDVKLTHRFAICSNPKRGTLLYYARYLLLLLEISFHGVPWFLWLFYLYLTTPTPDRNIKAILFALIFDLIVIGSVKAVFKRKRPILNRDDMIATGGVDKYSFPSGHSSRAILMSNLIAALYSFQTFAFSYFLIIIWSYFTCISRIMLARHHFFDVAAGVLLGYLMYFATILLF